MVPDRPVASVSGGRDWAWNRWQAERRAQDGPAVAGSTRSRGGRAASGRERPRSPDRATVRRLEHELQRTETQLQSIITRYERLLAEKNRQLDEEATAETASEPLRTALSARVRRLALR